jgi:hypothetical protein
MRFADYVDQSAPEKFAMLNSVMKLRSRDDAVGSVPRSEIGLGQLRVRFLVTDDNSSGTVAAFEVTAAAEARLMAPVRSHDRYARGKRSADLDGRWKSD